MNDPDYTVSFAVRNGRVSPAGNEFESEEVTVNIEESDEELVRGTYEYESNPSFGSPNTAEGIILFDKESPLIAITTLYDTPKPASVFRSLDEAIPTGISAPTVPAENQHDLYRDTGFGHGINGYTISFKESQSTYEIGGSDFSGTLDPEDEAEERAKYSNERLSDELVHEIAEDAMEDGMYIWSADLVLGDHSIGFSDPIRFTGVSDDFVDENGFELLFEKSRDLIES